MASSSLLASFVLFAFFTSIVSAQEKISVTVYFESYCPDSVKFLTKQLYPAYTSSLMKYMNITLVPYGKAKTTKSDTGDLKFECHHGEKECKGNKVIACTLHDKEASFADQFKFINCTSSMIAANTKLEEYPVKECSSGSTIKSEAILTCAGDPTGSDYLEEFGNKTMAAFPNGIASVPSIVFNDKFVESENKMGVSDFRKTLCSKITGTKPAECTKSGASTITQSALLPIITAVFVISRV